MLQTLHKYISSGKPIYGMNRGSVGFLMNEYAEDALVERIWNSERSVIHPLLMTTVDIHGERQDALAINEVSLLRQTSQVAKLRISVDGHPRMDELIADGVLIATPAGSTAYNLSANGPILPLNATLLALTPISPFRPRRWRGALLPDRVAMTIEVLESAKRPVSATADHPRGARRRDRLGRHGSHAIDDPHARPRPFAGRADPARTVRVAMHTTNLRKVGGSIMLAVPPALLDVLRLSAGAKVGLAVDNGRLVVEPQARPRYTMAELLAASDYSQQQPSSEREWVDAPAAGEELL
jgi:antitoxin component of MazEF toxin-antitoxin module